MPMRYIIPDIHGHFKEFEELLDKIGLTTDDQLFLLGDYIDRGPSSKAVVDRVIELVNSNYNVIALRGNHEEMFLKSSNKLEEFSIMSNKRKKPFCDENGRVKVEYKEFFDSLPHYAETDDFIAVHAGINFRKKEPFKDKHSMLWMREVRYVPDDFEKTIIHGHDPYSFNVIQSRIDENEQVLTLDNGVYMKNQGFGKLLCLNWEKRNY